VTTGSNFTIVIPPELGPHDWHPNGRLRHQLFGEIAGPIETSTSSSSSSASSLTSGWFGPTSPRSEPSSFKVSSSTLTPTSPEASTYWDEETNPEAPSAVMASLLKISWDHQSQKDGVEPRGASVEAQVEWLQGSIRAKRDILLLNSPEPGGGGHFLVRTDQWSTTRTGCLRRYVLF